MKCRVIIDETHKEEVIIYAHKRDEFVEQLENMIEGKNKTLIGYLRDEIVTLDTNNVFCFTVENGKLYAICEKDKYLLKTRLYAIEEMLDKNFIKINQSSIVNVNKISKFDASIGGALKVILKNGYVDYVSRRNTKNIKERLGL